MNKVGTTKLYEMESMSGDVRDYVIRSCHIQVICLQSR